MQVSYRYDNVISHCLQKETLHVGRRDRDAIMDSMSKITHASLILESRESDFVPEQTVVPRLHATEMSFRTGTGTGVN